MAGVCSTPGCPDFTVAKGKCATCSRDTERHQRRTTPTKATRTWTERKRRTAAVDAHRKQHGNWCPGYQVPAHEAHDLTADHVTSVAQGGKASGPLQVLCRACNSSKGARP